MGSGNTVPRITEAEHIGPNDTGDNIEAKRVANYVAPDGITWARDTGNIRVAGADASVDNPIPVNDPIVAANTNKDSTGYTFYSAKITTTAGDVITPTSGKALKIYKVLIINSANNSIFVDVSLTGSTKGTFLQGESIASSWVVTLAVDETLTIGTDVNGTVYVNIQYTEV